MKGVQYTAISPEMILRLSLATCRGDRFRGKVNKQTSQENKVRTVPHKQ